MMTTDEELRELKLELLKIYTSNKPRDHDRVAKLHKEAALLMVQMVEET